MIMHTDSRLIISMQLNCVSVHEATAAFCRDPTIDGNRVLEENKVDVELLKDYQQYDLRS